MMKRALTLLPEGRTRDSALCAAGMASLLTGARLPAIALFARGFAGLERAWRAEHPDFRGGLAERWRRAAAFYEETHQHETNRLLHVVGIPMIVAGAGGLLLFRPINPLWWGAAASFTAGWALNLVGHAAFERNAPAFSADPMSFFVGPVWDAREILRRRKARAREAAPAAA